MESWVVIVGIIIFFVIINKISSHISNKAKIIADEIFKSRQKELELIIDNKKKEIEREISIKNIQLEKKEQYIANLRSSFEESYYNGRLWLAGFVAEADKVFDDQISNYLTKKKRPAEKTADLIKKTNQEKRSALKQVKFLEYQLKSYKEYFPFLEEFEQIILSEQIDFSSENKDDVIKDIDRATIYLNKEEFEKLPNAERNQLALDRYKDKHKQKWEIGRLYERFIGFKYESDGWEVDYIGALKGFEDMGRDLICKKDGKIHIIQAKCWSKNSTIHEKHIFQLFGTTLCYEMENSLLRGFVTPVFITTTTLSPVAIFAASSLGVIVKKISLDKNYPMIKCNINQENKIYHLPFDQQYDRVKIDKDGEFYVETVQEAETKGFRRAKKYFGTSN